MVPQLIFDLVVCILIVAGEVYERERERQHALLRLDRSCDLGSCFPVSGDLLIGREDRLSATSTCGTYKPERYCEITDLRRKTCFWCDSSGDTVNNLKLNHRIHNVIYKYSGTRGESWWQSENGKENVSIQLDLEAEFRLNQLIMQFKTYLPKAMLVEMSTDFGKTWRVYRYFAYNCTESFPGIPEITISLMEVACESLYSGVIPSTDGIFNLRFLPLGVGPYSEEAKIFLRTTNLRINFTKLHSFASNGEILYNSDNRAAIGDNYYAIKKITVLGSCFCNGHAARCIPFSGNDSNDNMVYGRCKCAHNTLGINCELCDDLFNDLPWQPAVAKKTNACKKCPCNNNATKCHFDPELYNKSGKLRGGVCDD
ncbi:laminin subunit beta-1-like [Cydia amplana]|uniref:laminin subunit beta-1-like n=1 Tax=Cydia amplana TaxID=1869771 RepID=UPI002FE5E27E